MELMTDASPLFRLHIHAPVGISRSQEQSLDNDAVFAPLTEASPELVHCEAERGALEQLLRSGPGAFYARLCQARLGAFLSPDEVSQVSGWAEDHGGSEADEEDDGDENGSAGEPFSVQYFPVRSDTPAPALELGWPEKHVWERMDQAAVYTSPPAEGAPHVREVVRRTLQGANLLIAIVTDRLTDIMIIRDLQHVASRGVPVYIILNRRAAQENFTADRLRHPNIRIRTAGGKVFLSRDGRRVVGDLKENFILVDLEVVVLGSYNLTWTDAHLHRQLITVLRGPALQAFDREFRILYAASMPIPDVWKHDSPTCTLQPDRSHALHRSEHTEEPNSHKPVLLQNLPSPPAPPTDSPIDWDTLGVTKWSRDLSEDSGPLSGLCAELPVYHTPELNLQMEVIGATMDFGTQGWRDGSKQVMSSSFGLYPTVTDEARHMTDYHTMSRLYPTVTDEARHMTDYHTMSRLYPTLTDEARHMTDYHTMSRLYPTLTDEARHMTDYHTMSRLYPTVTDEARHMTDYHTMSRLYPTVTDEARHMTDYHTMSRLYPTVTDEARHMTDYHTMSRNMEIPERTPYRRLTASSAAEWEERMAMLRPRPDMNLREEFGLFSHALRRDTPLRMDAGLGGSATPEEAIPWSATTAASHQKPLNDGSSFLSDILKRSGSRENSSSLHTREVTSTASKSLLDPSEDLPTGGDHFLLTPAVALIKKRNDSIKAGLMRSPRGVIPRSLSFGLQRETWKSPLFRAHKSEEGN